MYLCQRMNARINVMAKLDRLRIIEVETLRLRIGLPAELRRYRKKHGVGLNEMARRMKVSPAYLSDIEHGRRHLSAAMIEDLLIFWT